MIFVFFKLIFCIGFIINMQFSKIDCNENLVVALLKIELNENNRYVPEHITAYQSRNPIFIDPTTNMPYIFNVKLQMSINPGQVIDEFCYNINKDSQIIMRENNLNKSLSQRFLATMNIMKHKEEIHRLSQFDSTYLDDFRQTQFYRYLLYPHDNEDIYEYWTRIEEKLKTCLLDNNKFHFVPVKLNHIDEIRTKIVYVQQDEGETDNDFFIRLLKHHKWFETMISTRPINGEGIYNYHLRMIRLGVASLTRKNIDIFYKYFVRKEKPDLQIYKIDNNFDITEYFVSHIICHCLPDSEFKRVNKLISNKSKNVRGESSQSQGDTSKRNRRT